MKKFSIFLLFIVALVGLSSCEHDDDVVFVAQPDPEGVMFTNTFASNYTLTSQVSGNLAERFVWNEVDFGAPTTVTYELQGSASSDFSSFDVIGSTSQTNLGVTVGQMIALAEDAGLDNDPNTEMPNTGMVYFRVRAYAGSGDGNALEEMSEVVSLNVTLPEVGEEEPETKMNLFFVGDATAAGWNNNNNNTPMFRDPENDNVFYFQGRFAGGDDVEGFKLLEVLGQWQPQWGGTDGVLGVNPGDTDDPAAFSVDADAYYSLMVNVDDMTYTWEEVDESGAATYASIGIIGPAQAGGWDADTDMTQSEFDPHIWYINDLEMTAGEFKFRANDDWADNWGVASSALSDQSNYGSGDNMTAEEGVYDVWFNDLTGRYILIPQAEE
ncbi:SusF/SusE family outer membrane protein [Gramella sp. GC03-9]|uniref:SusF/SusE family outer membrane protein n=1 Tax=Christiangramia oceanisediminis TaxID=2920386 RepID=A0A9X2KZ00_9FLAO|nr:SusF/SusE family outer membrane protein [Gramella oceanisediminis]MCP9200958.1 SusF/SusE family outer membrane protein [Gramella oceanisediminis]